MSAGHPGKIKATALFLMAVIDASILTSIVSTQLVLADIQSFGLDVSAADRLQTTLHDVLGLALPLIGAIGLSFLVAFRVARYAIVRTGGYNAIWYMAAGFTSVPAAIYITRLVMGVTVLASARTPLGMFLVACCSMAGGWIYFYLISQYGDAERADA